MVFSQQTKYQRTLFQRTLAIILLLSLLSLSSCSTLPKPVRAEEDTAATDGNGIKITREGRFATVEGESIIIKPDIGPAAKFIAGQLKANGIHDHRVIIGEFTTTGLIPGTSRLGHRRNVFMQHLEDTLKTDIGHNVVLGFLAYQKWDRIIKQMEKGDYDQSVSGGHLKDAGVMLTANLIPHIQSGYVTVLLNGWDAATGVTIKGLNVKCNIDITGETLGLWNQWIGEGVTLNYEIKTEDGRNIREEPWMKTGEKYRISLMTRETAWVYIVQITADNEAYAVFPSRVLPCESPNPLTAGGWVVYPGCRNQKFIDLRLRQGETRGKETIVIMASRTKNDAMERIMAQCIKMDGTGGGSQGNSRVAVREIDEQYAKSPGVRLQGQTRVTHSQTDDVVTMETISSMTGNFDFVEKFTFEHLPAG